MTEPEEPITVQNAGNKEAELTVVGTFEPRLTLSLVEELNRRKINHRVEDSDNFRSTLYAIKQSANEAAEVLADIKKEHPRVRI